MDFYCMSVLDLARHIKQQIAATVKHLDSYKDSQFELDECEVFLIKAVFLLMDRRIDKAIMSLEAGNSYNGLGRKLVGELYGNQADILRHATGCLTVSGSLVNRLYDFNQFIKLVTS